MMGIFSRIHSGILTVVFRDAESRLAVAERPLRACLRRRFTVVGRFLRGLVERLARSVVGVLAYGSASAALFHVKYTGKCRQSGGWDVI
jgi:hypothetical protein